MQQSMAQMRLREIRLFIIIMMVLPFLRLRIRMVIRLLQEYGKEREEDEKGITEAKR